MDIQDKAAIIKRLLVLLADCQALIAEHKPDSFEGFPESYEEDYEHVQEEIEQLFLSLRAK